MRQLTLLVIISTGILGFFSMSCEGPELEGDPRKLSVYTVQVKRTDVDFILQSIDCKDIPVNPCFCVDTIPLDTTIIVTHLKNCGTDGTADNINIAATLYPGSGSVIELAEVNYNPDTLAQDSASIFGFTSVGFHADIDSIRFIVEYNWHGQRATRKDTTISKPACGEGCD